MVNVLKRSKVTVIIIRAHLPCILISIIIIVLKKHTNIGVTFDILPVNRVVKCLCAVVSLYWSPESLIASEIGESSTRSANGVRDRRITSEIGR